MPSARITGRALRITRWMLRVVLVVGVLFLLLSVLFVITGQRALNVVLPPFLLGASLDLDRDGEDLSALRQKPVRKKSGIAGAKTH